MEKPGSGEALDKPDSGWRARAHEIIFEADTAAGRAFDVVLLWAIVISVLTVMFESVAEYREAYGPLLTGLEWFFTILFTVEYGFRLACLKRPGSYATSFFGVVDLLAVIPTYLSLMMAGAQSLIVIRILRLLRVFRVLKLAHYVVEARVLRLALAASRPKITVFLTGVLSLVMIFGTLIYLIEGDVHGFTSIPRSVYWAIVTMTTVGYGDITPQSPLGQFLSAMLMILGYGMIAVPTGIVSVEISKKTDSITTQACPSCSREGHDSDADFCKFCGHTL
jgi:voltage-gated potassium channel